MDRQEGLSSPGPEARYRALVMASTDVVYCMSPDWTQMRHLIGRDFIEDAPQPTETWLQKYIHPDDQPRVMEVINQAIATRSVFELEHRVRRKDGTLGWTQSRAVPMLDEAGEVVEWIGMATDITEKKNLEQELRLRARELQQRSHDLARLTEQLTLAQHRERRHLADHLHDGLQQLLVAADLKLHALWQPRDDAEQQACDAVRRILHDALQETRCMTRGLAPPFSLSDRLADALEWAARDIRGLHGISLELSVSGEPRQVPEAVGVLLYTASRELLLNIAKHAGTDAAQLELESQCDGITLRIRDGGRGFDQNPRAGVWEQPRQGVGLLSIRERVRLLGGDFQVNTAPGKGTEVTIRLPLSSAGEVDDPA